MSCWLRGTRDFDHGPLHGAQRSRSTSLLLAERGRFELPSPVKGCQFSRLVQSTALPPLHPADETPQPECYQKQSGEDRRGAPLQTGGSQVR
jgi:hypothetical protein